MAAEQRTTVPAQPAIGVRLSVYADVLLKALPLLWVVVLAAFVLLNEHFFQDVATYYRAGQAIAAGSNPYQGPDYAFRYWPIVAWLWSGPARLPLILVQAAVGTGMAAAAALAVALFVRSLSADGVEVRRPALTVLAFSPAALTLAVTGQLAGLSLVCFALAWRLRDRPLLAGALLVVTGLKPQYIVLALPLLAVLPRRSWLAFAAGMLAWPMLSVLVAGPQLFWHYLQVLSALNATGSTLVTAEVSWFFLVPGMFHLRIIAEAIALAVLVTLVIREAWRVQRRERPSDRRLEVLTAAAFCAMPHAVAYDLLFLTPLFLRLLAEWPPVRWVVLVVWFLIPTLGFALLNSGGSMLGGIAPPVLLLLGVLNGARAHAAISHDGRAGALAVAAQR